MFVIYIVYDELGDNMHKYLNGNTFEIVNDIFEVDDLIAETISILNKKGYHTLYCCSGHVKDPRLYEKYHLHKDELNDKHNYHIINEEDDYVDVLIPYQDTVVYIMFDKRYDFDLSKSFEWIDDKTIYSYEISYYEDNEKRNSNDIQKEIENVNNELLSWALSLPNNN